MAPPLEMYLPRGCKYVPPGPECVTQCPGKGGRCPRRCGRKSQPGRPPSCTSWSRTSSPRKSAVTSPTSNRSSSPSQTRASSLSITYSCSPRPFSGPCSPRPPRSSRPCSPRPRYSCPNPLRPSAPLHSRPNASGVATLTNQTPCLSPRISRPRSPKSSPLVYHEKAWNSGESGDGRPGTTYDEVKERPSSQCRQSTFSSMAFGSFDIQDLSEPYPRRCRELYPMYQRAKPGILQAGTGTHAGPRRMLTHSRQSGQVEAVYLPPTNEKLALAIRCRATTVVAPQLPPVIFSREPAQAVGVTKMRPRDPLSDIDTCVKYDPPPPPLATKVAQSCPVTPPATAPGSPAPCGMVSTISSFFVREPGETCCTLATRPSERAVSGRSEVILANHFKVKDSFKFGDVHAKTMTINPRAPRVLKNKILDFVKDKIREKFGANLTLSFDGGVTLYSNESFPFGTLCERYSPAASERLSDPYFEVTLESKGPFCGKTLEDHLWGVDGCDYQEYIKALGYIMREQKRNNCKVVQVGPCLYSPEASHTTPINKFINSCTGFFKSLRPTKQGLALNVDVSSCKFFAKDLKMESILDFVIEMMDKGLNFKLKKTSELNLEQRDFCVNLLAGTEVMLDYYAGDVIRKFKIQGLSERPTYRLTFCKLPERIGNSIVDYYREKYDKDIEWTFLPCLKLKSSKGNVFVPMELAKISPVSKFSGKGIVTGKDHQVAMKNPDIRCKRITELMEREYTVDINRPTSDPYCAAFDLAFDTSMTEIQSRVLRAPIIQYKDFQDHVDPGKVGFWAWNHKQALQDAKIKWWGVCDLTGGKFTKRTEWIHFLVSRASEMGITMLKPQSTGKAHVAHLDTLSTTFNLIQGAIPQNEKEGGALVQLIIVVVDGKRSRLYNGIKYFGDIEKGVPIQVVDYYPLQQSYVHDKYFNKISATNLLMKINLKCGGRNFRLHQTIDHVGNLSSIRNRSCMFVGADVTHPDSNDKEAPSIAALVASNDWPDSGRFIARHRAQSRGSEIIENLAELVFDLLREWHRANRHALPQIIIIYRDGVGESQFKEVLGTEVKAVKDAAHLAGTQLLARSNYNPGITFAVVQKRHHTRLFRKICDKKYGKSPLITSAALSGCRDLNVPPGTVVDDKVVHPRDFDFYLCSHSGEKGTSRPTHYHMIADDTKFSADDFQNLTNKLCYMFGRCTRAVSMVAPVYCAHLVAFRARVWYLAKRTKRKFACSPQSFMPSLPHSVHENLKNRMYFL